MGDFLQEWILGFLLKMHPHENTQILHQRGQEQNPSVSLGVADGWSDWNLHILQKFFVGSARWRTPRVLGPKMSLTNLTVQETTEPSLLHILVFLQSLYNNYFPKHRIHAHASECST